MLRRIFDADVESAGNRTSHADDDAVVGCERFADGERAAVARGVECQQCERRELVLRRPSRTARLHAVDDHALFRDDAVELVGHLAAFDHQERHVRADLDARHAIVRRRLRQAHGVQVVFDRASDVLRDGGWVQPFDQPLRPRGRMRAARAGHVVVFEHVAAERIQVVDRREDVHQFHRPRAERFGHVEPRPESVQLALAGWRFAEHHECGGVEPLRAQRCAELALERVGRDVLLIEHLHRQHGRVEVRES